MKILTLVLFLNLMLSVLCVSVLAITDYNYFPAIFASGALAFLSLTFCTALAFVFTDGAGDM